MKDLPTPVGPVSIFLRKRQPVQQPAQLAPGNCYRAGARVGGPTEPSPLKATVVQKPLWSHSSILILSRSRLQKANKQGENKNPHYASESFRVRTRLHNDGRTADPNLESAVRNGRFTPCSMAHLAPVSPLALNSLTMALHFSCNSVSGISQSP